LLSEGRIDDKAQSGFLVGYAQANTGYMIFEPSLDKQLIVYVHVVFNEVIPDPTPRSTFLSSNSSRSRLLQTNMTPPIAISLFVTSENVETLLS
jgi:hypothetical protein